MLGIRLDVLAIVVSVLGVVGLATERAEASTHVVAPAGGGLGALDVEVDVRSRIVVANGKPIVVDARAALEGADATAEVVAIGHARHVVHVRVGQTDAPLGSIAWEAILASGKAAPIFEGITGFLEGDPGERTGTALQIVQDGETSYVVVGEVREELHLCGVAQTLLEPRALYPLSLDLRPATVQRLTPAQRAAARPILAIDKASQFTPPLAPLLTARGSSVAQSRGTELSDGDPQTVWSERRPGIGQGEFVVMAAPKDVPIMKMDLVVAPPKPESNGAAPKRFYLVTDTDVFDVTVPDGAWRKPGEAYEIAFDRPVETSCVALVLNDAPRTLPHPDVTVAELSASSEFDVPGVTLDDVARKLSSDRGVAAAEVLKRAGATALVAVERHYGELSERGRALAMDVAASAECEKGAPLLARALCDASGEAPHKARERLERCPSAAPALAVKLRDERDSRACVAPALAAIAPVQALEPIADALAASSESERTERAVLRAAFGSALETATRGDSGHSVRDRLAALVSDPKRNSTTRLELLRAARGHVTEIAEESRAVLADLLRGEVPIRIRYLVLEVLTQLARAGDATSMGRIASTMGRDSDWAVRERAAEVAAGLTDAQPSLAAAALDTEPRVREAALRSLAASTPSPGAVEAAASLLLKDPWSFVRLKSIAVLERAGAAATVDQTLAQALKDSSGRVRAAVLDAMGVRRGSGWHERIREGLDDVYDEVEVRAAAARALGAVCDLGSADRLTQLARTMGAPNATEDQLELAVGALAGLSTMQPADLNGRLAPLLAPSSPPSVRASARAALAEGRKCGPGAPAIAPISR